MNIICEECETSLPGKKVAGNLLVGACGNCTIPSVLNPFNDF
jgi:hypothetical protein